MARLLADENFPWPVVEALRGLGHDVRTLADLGYAQQALPDQAVLLDLANRRFFFFMIEIWPHEFYFVAGLLIMAGLGLFYADFTTIPVPVGTP